MENLFILATRNKYRFQSQVGQLTVEDLWGLPITSQRSEALTLSMLAQNLNAKIKPTEGLEWLEIQRETVEQEELKNKLAIIKFIVETRRAEATARQEAESKAQLLAKLKAEQLRRKEQNLIGQSDEELEKLIAELEQKQLRSS